MKERHSAIVMGGSVGGMLAARVLSDHFKRVTIIDRDTMPMEPASRKGVPQSGHAHGLLAAGYLTMKEYFPDLMPELEALGCPVGDVVGDFVWFQYGHWKLRKNLGLPGLTVSRPCLESAIRRQVRKLPNVTLMPHTEALRPLFDESTGRVYGVETRNTDTGMEEPLFAELVVDASGRGSHCARWLEEWGFGAPPTQIIRVDVGYATRLFERQPGDFFGSNGTVIGGIPPKETRSCALIAVENNRWVLTLAGTRGDHPPADEEGWQQFAAGLPTPVIHDFIRSSRPISEITTYRFPTNQRRLFEKMKRFPEGYLPIGDAVCSFNPIYGQGMSAAAMEAKVLDAVLASGSENLARIFFARARKVVDIPWTIATGEDFKFAGSEIKRPPGSEFVDRYMQKLHAVASEDPFVCRRFFDVLNLLASPASLLAPSVAWRVMTKKPPRGIGSPEVRSAASRVGTMV